MKTTNLLDADVVAYRFANAAQTKIDWGDGVHSFEVLPEEEVFAEVQRYVLEQEERTGADETIVCLSCPTAEKWRTKLWPAYTSRKAEKPVLLNAVKGYLASRWRSYERPTLEADDILGILSTHPNIVPGKRIIVSIDKDLKTIPGWLFNPDKDDFPWEVSTPEANRWWLYQTLMGDRVDCYPGCPGIGPKKAGRILSQFNVERPNLRRWWEDVVFAFESRGLTADDALLQARLARILRHTDYDFKKKEVKLWTP
jgi:hypothetical protein